MKIEGKVVHKKLSDALKKLGQSARSKFIWCYDFALGGRCYAVMSCVKMFKTISQCPKEKCFFEEIVTVDKCCNFFF